MLDRKEAKEIAQFVLKELRKTSYPYATDAKFDYRKSGMGRAKGGTIGQIGPEYQHYVCDVAWTSTGEDTIEWSAGSVKLADGRTQSLNSGGVTLEGTSLNYFWAVIGNPEIQTSTNYYDGVGDDKSLLAFATKAPENDQLALVFPFFGTEPTFNSDVLSVNMVLAAHIKAGVITASHIEVGTITADRLSFTAFIVGSDTLDDVLDGTTYSRVLTTDIQAGHIKLSETIGSLDDIADDTYGKVLTTDISAGHILLSSVTQSSTYRTVNDTEKGTWNGKPDDMDEIGEGGTYGKIRQTQIDTGYLKLTSATVKSSEWYNESGVEIDANNGINIYGTNNALTTRATKTGTIQCSVNSSGEITAGAGVLRLNSDGLNVYGYTQAVYFRSSGGTLYGYIWLYGAGIVQLYATSTVWINASLEVNQIRSNSGSLTLYPQSSSDIITRTSSDNSLRPYIAGYTNLGHPSYRWRNVFGNPILTTTYYALYEGELVMVGGGSGDLHIYSDGAWRTNT